MSRTEMDTFNYLKAMAEEKAKEEKRKRYSEDAELMMVSLDTMMSRYRRVVLRFNSEMPGTVCKDCGEKLNFDRPRGLKEYGLPNAAYQFAQDGIIDPDPAEELMSFMQDEIPVPDVDFIDNAECWFTEKGFKICAPYIYDVVMECCRKGFCPTIYSAYDFPVHSIVYADEFQIVIDRDKLK